MRAKLHRESPGEVFDGRYVVERIAQSFIEEPLEAISLKRDKVWDLENLGNLGEATALAPNGADDGGTFSVGHQAIPPSRGGLNLPTIVAK